MVTPLMTDTLPTIIGMGVVSQTTTTMFGKRRGPARKSKQTKKQTVKRRRSNMAKRKGATSRKRSSAKTPRTRGGRVKTPLNRIKTLI